MNSDTRKTKPRIRRRTESPYSFSPSNHKCVICKKNEYEPGNEGVCYECLANTEYGKKVNREKRWYLYTEEREKVYESLNSDPCNIFLDKQSLYYIIDALNKQKLEADQKGFQDNRHTLEYIINILKKQRPKK